MPYRIRHDLVMEGYLSPSYMGGAMLPGFFQYQFITRLKTVSGTVYVNSGNRPVSGADVESVARTQTRNFTDPIFVPQFSYRNTPAETIWSERIMSASLWCDFDDPDTNAPHQTGHPFSSRDTGRKNMAFTEFDEDGNSHSVQGDTCGYHSAMNPFLRKHTAAIEAPDPVAKMERQNEDWQAGYDAALDRLARNSAEANKPITGTIDDTH